jgi:hypothetical protein
MLYYIRVSIEIERFLFSSNNITVVKHGMSSSLEILHLLRKKENLTFLTVVKEGKFVFMLNQVHANPSSQENKFYTVVLNICVSSLPIFLHVTFLAPRIMR